MTHLPDVATEFNGPRLANLRFVCDWEIRQKISGLRPMLDLDRRIDVLLAFATNMIHC